MGALVAEERDDDLHVAGAGQRAPRVVRLVGGRVEHDHDLVAHELVDGAVVHQRHARQLVEVGGQRGGHDLGRVDLAVAGEPGQVGEKHADLAAPGDERSLPALGDDARDLGEKYREKVELNHSTSRRMDARPAASFAARCEAKKARAVAAARASANHCAPASAGARNPAPRSMTVAPSPHAAAAAAA